MKLIFKIIKRIILSIFMIYAFNLVSAGMNIFIPINIITILVCSYLGFSGLIAFVAIYFVLL